LKSQLFHRARANKELSIASTSSTLSFLQYHNNSENLSSQNFKQFAMSSTKAGVRKRESDLERSKPDKKKQNFDLDLDFDLSEFVFDAFVDSLLFLFESHSNFLILCFFAVTSKESCRRCIWLEIRHRKTVRRRTKRQFPGTAFAFWFHRSLNFEDYTWNDSYVWAISTDLDFSPFHLACFYFYFRNSFRSEHFFIIIFYYLSLLWSYISGLRL